MSKKITSTRKSRSSRSAAVAVPKKATAKKPPVKKLINRFAIVLDASGSMTTIRDEALEATNQSINTIRENAKKTNQVTTTTFVTFGERSSSDVDVKIFNAPVEKLKPLTPEDYKPANLTPLFDAVGDTITRLEALKDSDNTSYVVMVVTDGAENASQRFTEEQVKTLMTRASKTDRWSFAFLCPPGGRSTLERFGIPPGNIKEWENTSKGVKEASSALTRGISSYFGVRSAGKTKTTGFFDTDLSKVSVSKVKKSLTDISDSFKVWKIPGEIDIQSFVESHGHMYTPGNGFYLLMKDEKVAWNKQILLMPKGEKTIYGGGEARALLGLPDGLDVKVRPGNHANWDVYVQSHSTNRKLVRGTNLLYRK